jgi:Cu/Ag efflux pump CusA
MILTRVFRIKTKDKIQIEHAIAQGTKSSIRTMLVTTLAIMIGIIIVTNRSIALKQLGIIIASGLVTSTLFTLFAFPAIYSIVYNLTRRRKNRKLLEKIGE